MARLPLGLAIRWAADRALSHRAVIRLADIYRGVSDVSLGMFAVLA